MTAPVRPRLALLVGVARVALRGYGLRRVNPLSTPTATEPA